MIVTLPFVPAPAARAASVSYAERQTPPKRTGVFMQALNEESAPRPVVTAATAPTARPTREAADTAGATDHASLPSDSLAVTDLPTSVWLGPDSRTPRPDEDLSAPPIDDTHAGVAVPIPPGVWTGLSGLAGLAAIYGWKSLRRGHRRARGRPA